MSLGKNLKRLRSQRGLSQYQVADKLEIQRGRYNSWENDIAKPSVEMLNKIADFYNVGVDFLLGRTDEKSHLNEFNEEVRSLARDINSLDSGQKDALKALIKTMQQRGKEAMDE
ncbi:helix-turn-helix domain-containing protein [Bacillus haynesii]|uniref:helix-turn-helix domain-containing protein n=1 Tax=Bacillus haynesii TaxID=1925021 RepID=UPI00227DE2CB|nr:helix-turn-helix transcriptional regulator [Bacillus haynesii]MCY8045737.1 helix-turn-helix domain-containing protein [Bacillus haynesii]MCY8080511.1 helix-turn-helix domain-containing protein [Bacillus haynesii]MCY8384877.1 helix-turn-helix domain-containing protein [Bacillus haynesii]MCY8590272.1 helix-turn-helix domain-containing protein [Bacillus haynesii]